MTKKRIHELAKQYGLSGKDLAAKLRARGFTNVKSHMTALDDFEVMQVQAVLEAHGIVPASAPDADAESIGGVILRKKKKKLLSEPSEEPSAGGADEEVVEEEALAEAEELEAEPAPAAVRGTSHTPAPVEAPAPPDGPEAEAEEWIEEELEPEPSLVADEAAYAEEIDEVVELDLAREPELAAAGAAEAPPIAAALESVAPPEAPPAVLPTAAAPGVVAPSAQDKMPKRQGKVVGFIDLSKFKPTPQRKTESRRLGSGDEELPDVRPTLRHDPRRALMRGDRGSRDQLSAAQLREREAGRYLRRGRAPGAPTPQRSAAKPGGRRLGALGSPYAGNVVRIESPVTIKKLAEVLAIKSNQLLRVAFEQLGFGAVNINSLLDEETAQLLGNEFEVELNIVREIEAEEALIEDLKKKRSEVADEDLAKRNPTIAVLGHVDHGKTTLIDYIRKSHVAAGEEGGITQHIGAYRITTESGHPLTVLDTPGHAAFTRMRARGAQAVDVVVLVVAADSGVQPQTEEALNHARAAGTPVVVALTKVDRPEANTARAKQQLAGLGLNSEEWGGETGVVEVSGVTGQGVEQLLERVFLESELLELQCHPDSPAKGVVLEAEVQQGKGIVAHLLIQDGTLNRGDVILAGEGYGKVRSIHDDLGRILENAGPSVPVEVSGLSALPGIGEPFHVVEKLDDAKEVAEERARKGRAASLAEKRKLGGHDLLQQVTGPGRETVNFIVRADVQGSAEVLHQAISDLGQAEVEARVLQSGVGAVTENDILLASTSNALIVAFRVGVGGQARQAAEREGVPIKSYQVLYDVLDDARELMEGRLAPDVQEELTGHAEVRRIFKSSRFGSIAGCYVLDGTIARDNRVRLLRDGTVIHTGTMASLRREKDDVREVREGFECGILLRGYNDLREGDVIEAYKMVEIKRTLSQKSDK